MHKNSITAYYKRIQEGTAYEVDKRVIHFLSHFNDESFARFHLIKLLDISECTLCGVLNKLEFKLKLVDDVGSIMSRHKKPNKLYQWNEGIKKESPQKRLF